MSDSESVRQFLAARAALATRRQQLAAELREIDAALADATEKAPPTVRRAVGQTSHSTGITDFVKRALSKSAWKTAATIHAGHAQHGVDNIRAVLCSLEQRGLAKKKRGANGILRWQSAGPPRGPSGQSARKTASAFGRTPAAEYCRSALSRIASGSGLTAVELSATDRRFTLKQIEMALWALYSGGEIERLTGGRPFRYAWKLTAEGSDAHAVAREASGHGNEQIPIDESPPASPGSGATT